MDWIAARLGRSAEPGKMRSTEEGKIVHCYRNFLIGSSMFTGDADETVIDHAAMAAQLARGVIDYGASVIPE